MKKEEINILNNIGIADDYIEFGIDYKTGLWTFKSIKVDTKNVERELKKDGRIENIMKMATELLARRNNGIKEKPNPSTLKNPTVKGTT